ncbi:response regulator transcription factor [Methylobacterium komagatae]
MERDASSKTASRELGYVTVWAEDGHQALGEIEREPSRFEVVLSNVVMPGIHGVQLAGEIRRRRPGLPVVPTSGYSDVHLDVREGSVQRPRGKLNDLLAHGSGSR